MPVSFACSGCGFQTKVKDQLAGKKIKCPKCGTPGAVAALAPQEVEPEADAFLKVNLDSFQDVVPEEGEELPPELAPKKPAAKKKKKKKATSKHPPLSGSVTGAAMLFSLLSVAVIAMLVMFVVPELLPYLSPKPAEEKPAAAAPAG